MDTFNPVIMISPKDSGHNNIGYDLTITDERATVQDYIDAMKNAIQTFPLTFRRKNGETCAGCARCCQDVIRLTWIDVMLIRKQLGLGQVARIQVRDSRGDGLCIGVTLREDKDGFCSFLDREKRLCTIYPVRPLICQVYVCGLSTRKASNVRDCIIQKGEEDLIHRWSTQAQEWGTFEFAFFNKEKGVNVHHGLIEDWPPNAFSGKTHYSEVLLKELLPPSLWMQVFEAGHP